MVSVFTHVDFRSTSWKIEIKYWWNIDNCLHKHVDITITITSSEKYVQNKQQYLDQINFRMILDQPLLIQHIGNTIEVYDNSPIFNITSNIKHLYSSKTHCVTAHMITVLSRLKYICRSTSESQRSEYIMVSAAFVYGVNPRLFKPVSTCFTLLFSPVLQRMVVTIFRLYWTVYKD